MDQRILIAGTLIVVVLFALTYTNSEKITTILKCAEKDSKSKETFYILKNGSGLIIGKPLKGSYKLVDGTIIKKDNVTEISAFRATDEITTYQNIKKIYCVEPPRGGKITDPVCGTDGNSYVSEKYAKIAGITVAYKGICNKSKLCESRCKKEPPKYICPDNSTVLNIANCPTAQTNSTQNITNTTKACVEKGKKCSRDAGTYSKVYTKTMQGDCCSGLFCDESFLCTSRLICGVGNENCGSNGSEYFGSCCADYSCVNNTCLRTQCIQEYGNCINTGDCCENLTCNKNSQCVKPCKALGVECVNSLECCGATYCVDGTCKQQKCAKAGKFCRSPGDTAYGSEYDCCEGYKCESNQCVLNVTSTTCTGPKTPEWYATSSCATGHYKGDYGTYCGYCEESISYRYYCSDNEVVLATDDCMYGCSGTMCY